MELRVLRYFLATAREGSILGAARFLHVTQPTLSRQLQELEEELGQKLLIRSNRHITLTPEGKLFRKRAEDVMEIIQKTEAEFRSMGSALRGDIHIGSGETDAMKQIARIFRELHEEYPGIRYHLRSGKSEEIEELVAGEEGDEKVVAATGRLKNERTHKSMRSGVTAQQRSPTYT